MQLENIVEKILLMIGNFFHCLCNIYFDVIVYFMFGGLKINNLQIRFFFYPFFGVESSRLKLIGEIFLSSNIRRNYNIFSLGIEGKLSNLSSLLFVLDGVPNIYVKMLLLHKSTQIKTGQCFNANTKKTVF